MTAVIEVSEVNKRFRIHHERSKSLKERIIHPGQGSYSDVQALRDVNFSVGTQETVGIIGRNGSGKSTLLKCICGVLKPTSGQILIRGTLAGLLELGAGFQHELSGRDNVYLSGSMLGLSTKTIDRLFDSIVEFSELEKFIDTEVKFYSSGMYLRLAFSVAVNVDPDILVIDEILAVGDERFATKCIDRIGQFQKEGRTILLFSPSADMIRGLCHRAVVLDQGQVIADGPTGDSIRVFRERMLADAPKPIEEAASAGSATIEAVTTPSGRFNILSGQRLQLNVDLVAHHGFDGHFMMEMFSTEGKLVTRTDPMMNSVSFSPGPHRITVDLPEVPLTDGDYDINLGLVGPDGYEVLAWREQVAKLQVTYNGRGAGWMAMPIEVSVN